MKMICFCKSSNPKIEVMDDRYIFRPTFKLRDKKFNFWFFCCCIGSNPKIEVMDDRYIFRPPFKLRDKKSLIKLLKRRDLNGEGGVMYDDIIESLGKFINPCCGSGRIRNFLGNFQISLNNVGRIRVRIRYNFVAGSESFRMYNTGLYAQWNDYLSKNGHDDEQVEILMGIIFHGKLKPELRTMFWFSKYLGLVLTYNTIQYFQQCFLYLSFFTKARQRRLSRLWQATGKSSRLIDPATSAAFSSTTTIPQTLKWMKSSSSRSALFLCIIGSKFALFLCETTLWALFPCMLRFPVSIVSSVELCSKLPCVSLWALCPFELYLLISLWDFVSLWAWSSSELCFLVSFVSLELCLPVSFFSFLVSSVSFWVLFPSFWA